MRLAKRCGVAVQVFNSEGVHLCTRSDLGLAAGFLMGLAWGAKGQGQLAVASGEAHAVRAWH